MNFIDVVVFGAKDTGKTSMIIQYHEGRLYEDRDVTQGDDPRKTIQIDNDDYVVLLTDTSGSEEHHNLQNGYMIKSVPQGFMLVYSVTDQASFDYLPAMRDRILQAKATDHVPMVLVANKCESEDHLRVISALQGKALADAFGCPFYEASARNNFNIAEIFDDLTRQIVAPPSKRREACAVM